jgi:multisubunit Na+/H+ antiporter MnhC subunit
MDIGVIFHAAALGLILIGIAGIVLSNHLVRIIFAIALLEAGANLLLVLAGYRSDGDAPIIVAGQAPAVMVDPVPQALVLTAIVIGVGVLALALALALRVQRAYGTLDIREVRRQLERDLAEQAGIELPTSSDAPSGIPASGVANVIKHQEEGA